MQTKLKRIFYVKLHGLYGMNDTLENVIAFVIHKSLVCKTHCFINKTNLAGKSSLTPYTKQTSIRVKKNFARNWLLLEVIGDPSIASLYQWRDAGTRKINLRS